MAELSQSVQDITKLVKKAIKAKPDGTFEVTGNPYEDAMKAAGLKKDDLKKSQTFNADFVAGVANAFGQESIDHLKKHTNQDTTSISIGMLGRDKVEMEFKKSETYRIPGEKGKEATPTTKYGVIKTRVKTKVGSKQGDLAEVYESINAVALKAFS